MADPNDSSLAFFTKATPVQWEYIYNLRKQVIQLKADQRSSKKGGPEEFIKLDTWFSTKLPQQIHSRKEPHVVYEELVQIAKWKLMMGKYRPKMLDLVRINTELSVVNTTRKAFKKITQQKNNPPGTGLSQAVQMLVNLKGIGPSTASAIMAAAYPEEAPFMSDEGMLSTPGVEATDSTLLEFNNYSEQLRNKTEALKKACPAFGWNPHKVDQVLWIYYLAKDLKPELLEDMPQGLQAGLSFSAAAAAAASAAASSSSLVEASDDNAVSAHDDLVENVGTGSEVSGAEDSNSALGGGAGMPTSTSDDGSSLMLNGLSSNNNNEDSYSVPYSEEDISASSSSNMGLPDSSNISSSSNNTNNNIGTQNNGNHLGSFGIMNSHLISNGNGVANGMHSNGSSNNNLVTTSHNSTSSSVPEEEDSKDCIDSEDSRDYVVSAGHLMVNTTTSLSEENSVDDGLMVANQNGGAQKNGSSLLRHHSDLEDLSNDCGIEDNSQDSQEDVVVDGPPLKKQKTLELASTLVDTATTEV